MGIQKVTAFEDERLDVYARLTDLQLRSRIEPSKAIFIAETVEVIGRALDGGNMLLSLLTEEKYLPQLEPLMDRLRAANPDAPIFVLPEDELRKLTGFELTRGALAAFRRPPERSVEEVVRDAHLVAVLENIRNHTNVGAIFRSAAALGADAVLAAALALVGCAAGTSGSGSASGSASASASGSASASTEMKLVKEGKLLIATSPDFPPFENLENGEMVGLDIEIGKAVAEKLGLEPEFVSLQFDSILTAVAAGTQADVGISGLTVDPERAKTVDFSDSYYVDDLSVAAMKNNADITADNADEALNKEGVVIAVQSGSSGETYVKENYPKATVQPYGNSTDAFAALQSGQANAVCTNKAVVERMLANAYTDAQVVKSIATGEEYAVAIAQENKALTAAINKALEELQADGTIDALVAKYM